MGVRFEVSAGKEGGEGEGDKGGGLAEERGEVGVEGEVAGQMLETQVEGGIGLLAVLTCEGERIQLAEVTGELAQFWAPQNCEFC